MLRHPLRNVMVTVLLLVAGGFVAIAEGKRVIAKTYDIYNQVPALVSGGIGGIALILTACVVAFVQVTRYLGVLERREEAAVLEEVVDLAQAFRERNAA